MYVRTLEQGLHFFSVRGFKFDLCVQYAESILEMMCRGTGPSSSEARSARKTESARRPNANGPSRTRENSCQVQAVGDYFLHFVLFACSLSFSPHTYH